MKHTILILSVFLLLASCSKEEIPVVSEQLELGEMEVTVERVDWAATNTKYRSYNGEVYASNEETNSKTGLRGSSISIIIDFKGSLEVKRYDASCEYKETIVNSNYSGNISWRDKIGSCEITELTDDYIKGLFLFYGENINAGLSKRISGVFYSPR